MITLARLNGMTHADFREALTNVFEHSPWVPERAWIERPFADINALHRSMCAVVAFAETCEQMDLIRAHPQLAGKAAIRGELTSASSSEQAGAGLDQCSAEEFATLCQLNEAYVEKFSFPFILAVRGHTRVSILAALETRLAQSVHDEFAQALIEIGRIARFRLGDLIQIDAAANHQPTPGKKP